MRKLRPRSDHAKGVRIDKLLRVIKEEYNFAQNKKNLEKEAKKKIADTLQHSSPEKHVQPPVKESVHYTYPIIQHTKDVGPYEDVAFSHDQMKSMVDDLFNTLKVAPKSKNGSVMLQQNMSDILYQLLIVNEANVSLENLSQMIQVHKKKMTYGDAQAIVSGSLSHAMMLAYLLIQRKDHYMVLHYNNMPQESLFFDAEKKIDLIAISKEIMIVDKKISLPVHLIDVKTEAGGVGKTTGLHIHAQKTSSADEIDETLWDTMLPQLERVVAEEISSDPLFSQKLYEKIAEQGLSSNEITIHFVPYRYRVKTRIRIEQRNEKYDRSLRQIKLFEDMDYQMLKREEELYTRE